jgi:hypothetical protein
MVELTSFSTVVKDGMEERKLAVGS